MKKLDVIVLSTAFCPLLLMMLSHEDSGIFLILSIANIAFVLGVLIKRTGRLGPFAKSAYTTVLFAPFLIWTIKFDRNVKTIVVWGCALIVIVLIGLVPTKKDSGSHSNNK